MNRIRVFVVDDHALVREGICALLSAERDMNVVGEASDGKSLVDRVAASGADVVVMDVAMPRVGGAAATEELRRALGHVKVLALSAHEDRAHIEQMLAAGAMGFIAKRSAAGELTRAIRCIAQGGTYVDPSIAPHILAGRLARHSGGQPSAAKLSEREAEVLRLVARGLSLKEMAEALDIGVRTIETYRARAMEKSGLRTRADVVRYAAERGWLTSS